MEIEGDSVDIFEIFLEIQKIHLEDSEGFSERRFKAKDSEDSEGRFKAKDSEGRFKVKDSEGRFKGEKIQCKKIQKEDSMKKIQWMKIQKRRFKIKDSMDEDSKGRFKIKDSMKKIQWIKLIQKEDSNGRMNGFK
ncbi:Hypothetical protein SRAE_0000028400 [Strongyloides ratti]|uniref:Uncharacterized protein n=1 Tax=Strongyloides ratti TaxID=34506 RepID=A0A090KUS1_STRRB|nr:Hypothetical protein SRAE_0000028400 [Strongyloides ratti]CEF61156.1 Hypothetical protein SRAE_0000028400 [Strongyloides ratti]